MINIFRQSAFGLDLSDLSLKIINLERKDNNIVLASFYRQEIPVGVIAHGEIKQEDTLVEILRSSLDKVAGRKLKNKRCIVSLPETDAFIRLVQLPPMDKKEVQEAIKWEAEANIPMPLSDIYLDWQVVAEYKDHQDVLISALPKTLVDDYLRAMKKAGLYPLAFEVESIATARAVIKEKADKKTVLIVDVGAERASFILVAGSTVFFTASLLMGNKRLIETIAKNLSVDKEKARQLKFDVGLGGGGEGEGKKIFEALKVDLKELTDKMKEYMAFYQSHSWPDTVGTSPIEEIILCGGGANLIGLVDFVSSETGVRARIANPWVNVLKVGFQDVPELPYQDSITYATALGLALRGLDNNIYD